MSIVKFPITFVQMLNCFLVFSTCAPPLAIHDPLVLDCTKSYNNIMRNLRDNWESPITYLKKRGYIPKSEEHCFPLSEDGVISQPPVNIKTTEDNNKQQQPTATADSNQVTPMQLKQNLDKMTKLRSYDTVNNLITAALVHHKNRLHGKVANVTSPTIAAAPPNLMTAPTKADIPLPLQVPSSIGADALKLPSSSSSAAVGGLNPRLESEHNVSFLHNMKEKLLGLFRNKQNDIKKDIYTFEYNTHGSDGVDGGNGQYQYNLNQNVGKGLDDESKEIDKEFQLILDQSLEKQKRRHNKQHAIKNKANKRQRPIKLNSDHDGNEADKSF